MHGRTDRLTAPRLRPARRALGRACRALALCLALALVLLGAAAAPVRAQSAVDERRGAAWEMAADRAEARIADPTTTTPEFNVLREELARQRSAALAAEQKAQPPIDELNSRLKALGSPPAEGVEEAPEIAQRRKDLQVEIAGAQVPLIEAQEALQRSNALIERIDKIVRGRFSAELMSRGPSPLLPATWLTSIEEVGKRILESHHALIGTFEDPVSRRIALRRLPVSIALVFGGLAVVFTLRRWLSEWIEARLARTTTRRQAALALALRNLTRLVVPAAGVGLIFAAFDPNELVAPAAGGRYFTVPAFAMILIAAAWLSSSLLAPHHKPFRLVPLEDHEAAAAGRLVLALGAIAALALMINGLAAHWELSTASQSAILFPLVLIGSLGLWRAAGLIHLATNRIDPGPVDRTGSQGSPRIALRLLRLLVRVLQVITIVAPILAAAGYIPLAGFLVFRSALTLGLLGTALVIFDLLDRTVLSLLLTPNAQGSDSNGGLAPVAVAALVGLASLAPLAMIWGARPSDIAEIWNWLRQGVTFGGMRISAGVVVTLIVVFALGMALTRLLQAVMRGTVLPRTRLDAGGRNAVLAGIGYIGFTLTALAAVSAAGLDLSNIAIVAGALSVGIGFGLQNVVSNFVSGIILLVERPVKEGDWIEVGGFSGYVKGINVRSTEIQTFDRASVILPNSDLVAGTVLNRTHSGMSGRLQVPVGVAYGSDPRRVEAVLLAIAEAHPLVLEEPAPVVLFLSFGDSCLNFEIRCWLRDVNFSLSARSDMNFEILERFRAEGIEIPFPQKDLHIKGFGAVASALHREGERSPDAPPAGDGDLPRTV